PAHRSAVMTTNLQTPLRADGKPMTHRKIILKAEQQPEPPGADFATLADQFIQESAYLPAAGDQSWREQDARRIFDGQGEDENNHTEAVPAEAEAPLSELNIPSPKALGILLPLSLATFVMVFAVTFSMPEILTAGFWSEVGAKQASGSAIAPAAVASAV